MKEAVQQKSQIAFVRPQFKDLLCSCAASSLQRGFPVSDVLLRQEEGSKSPVGGGVGRAGEAGRGRGAAGAGGAEGGPTTPFFTGGPTAAS